MFRTLLGASLLVSLQAMSASPADFANEQAHAEAQCRANITASVYNNCACVGRRTAEQAAHKSVPTEPRLRAAFFERISAESYPECPQDEPSVISASVAKSCTTMYASQRTDHVSYCKCVGDDVAAAFVAAPAIGLQKKDMLLRNALSKCGAITEATRVKDMKTPVAPGSAAAEKARADGEASCSANTFLSHFVNCACVGQTLAEYAATPGESRPIQSQNDAQLACPQRDPAPIEAYVFQGCDSYMVTVRTDHEAFCKCTAKKTAAAYLASPRVNLRYVENLRRNAMEECGIADKSTQIRQ